MNTKYVITRVYNNLIIARFTSNTCDCLNVLDSSSMLGDIYIGRVENIVKNINCAFIEIKRGVKCYYSLNDNKRHFFINRKNNTSVNISDLILVQVCQESMKTKPATVTSKLSLTGEYIVVSTDVTGISISDKTKKNPHCIELKEILMEEFKNSFSKYGFILRTNSSQASTEAVLNEAKELSTQLDVILTKSVYCVAYERLYKNQPSFINEIRKVRCENLEKIITDDNEIYSIINNCCNKDITEKLSLYEDELLPLSKLYSLETELSKALSRKVWLKCGGYLIIEQTEALTVIDVNSGKFTTSKKRVSAKEASVNAYKTVNLEAAYEIARQLRLRNISGIIIIDFINMDLTDDNSALLSELRRQLKQDTVTASVVDITKLGLVEITRKKNGKTLKEYFNNINGMRE